MKAHVGLRIIFTSLTLFTSFVLALSAQQKPPSFRAGIDLRQLDVSVLDKNRRPVRGLTAEDFVLTEEGAPQKIETFAFVDVPDTVTEAPAWASRTASDVVSNDGPTSRAFALVIDSAGDLWATRELSKSVATFVDQLGPTDAVAIVYVRRPAASLNFTRDTAKIVDSINGNTPQANNAASSLGSCPTSNTMLYLAQSLSGLKNLRKAIVYFGGRLGFTTITATLCGKIWFDFVQVANAHNITTYTVDTMGLRPYSQVAADQYLSLAHHTGGRALVNNNSFEEGLTRILAENTSYYLLGYQPTKEDDGRFRRVVVKVNRDDVEVVSTRSYWAPKPSPPNRPATPPEMTALAGLLPDAGIPLRATSAPFRAADEQAARATLALELRQPAFADRTRDIVDLLINIYAPNGTAFGSIRQSVGVTVPANPDPAGESRYEVVARVDLPKPGRYELRVSASSSATARTGSVYVDVEVPDYVRETLSLSGVVLANALSRTPSASARGLFDVVPVIPTVARTFAPGDSVTAYLRAYQGGGQNRSADVRLTTRILDAAGKSVFSQVETLPADRFDATRSAEYLTRLPLSTLTTGEYLLTIEATVGKITTKRDVRFVVR